MNLTSNLALYCQGDPKARGLFQPGDRVSFETVSADGHVKGMYHGRVSRVLDSGQVEVRARQRVGGAEVTVTHTMPVHKLRRDGMEAAEPVAGAPYHAHLEAVPSFHPPSLKNARHVPTDNPGEKDDRFGDVTKRKSRQTERMRTRLARRVHQPPTLRPDQVTAVQPHTGAAMAMFGQGQVVWAADDDCSWVTINGQHVCIRSGETAQQAFDRQLAHEKGGGKPQTRRDYIINSSKSPRHGEIVRKVIDSLPEHHRGWFERGNAIFYVRKGEAEKGHTGAGGYTESVPMPSGGSMPRVMLGTHTSIGSSQAEISPSLFREIAHHELGHVVEKSRLTDEDRAAFKALSGQVGRSKLSDRAGSGDWKEHFAEAYRVYTSKPDKLQKKEPGIYEFFKSRGF